MFMVVKRELSFFRKEDMCGFLKDLRILNPTCVTYHYEEGIAFEVWGIAPQKSVILYGKMERPSLQTVEEAIRTLKKEFRVVIEGRVILPYEVKKE